MLLALKMVAYVGIAPLAGELAHRLPRKPLLIALDLARAGFVLCLPFVDAVWQVYILIFLLNACSAGFTPTFQATIPDVLPDEKDYTRALSLSRLAYDLENLLSPSLAAAALVVMTYDALFVANAFAFLTSALLMYSVMLPKARPSYRTDGVWRNLAFGIRAYLATPRLRGLLALSFAITAAGAMVIVNTVVYVRDYLGGSETDTALAFAAAGAGSMVAALLLPRLLDRILDRPVMLAGSIILIFGLLLGLFQPGLLALLPIWFILGAGSSAIQTPTGRLLRRSCEEGDRPAFFAAQFALSHACWLITYPLAGWLGTTLGLGPTFGVLAFLAAVAVAAAALLWQPYDPEEIEHSHEAAQHTHLHVHDEHHQHEHDKGEGPKPHSHPHRHNPISHRHPFVIDLHHPRWPTIG